MSAPDEPIRGERALIARLAEILGLHESVRGPVGFGDDMAPIDPSLPAWLWACDQLSDGVDFESARHAWRDIGYKAMAVNLSDAAAMAAEPVAALCAVTLHEQLDPAAALELLAGVHDAARHFGCRLVGGDTNSWKAPTVITVTLAARCPAGAAPVTRAGARPGDQVWLTGPLGGSILGRHLHPQPRVREAIEIARRLHPHAMIDISDGLAIDLYHILDASGCGAALEQSRVEGVIHPDAHQLAAKTGRSPLEHALFDGEDFELIVVLPPDDASEAETLGLHRIGTIEPGPPQARLLRPDGSDAPLPRRGWEHFRGPSGGSQARSGGS